MEARTSSHASGLCRYAAKPNTVGRPSLFQACSEHKKLQTTRGGSLTKHGRPKAAARGTRHGAIHCGFGSTVICIAEASLRPCLITPLSHSISALVPVAALPGNLSFKCPVSARESCSASRSLVNVRINDVPFTSEMTKHHSPCLIKIACLISSGV